MSTRPLTHAELLELRRWNTPTIYNGWEQITTRNPAADCFNREEVRDFMPQMGPMVGWAITVVVEPSQRAHRESNPRAWSDYRRYVASLPGPKVVVVQDLDKPTFVGAFWGEVVSNMHRALDCVGTVIDGCIRDLDEMCYAGFKALARRLCVGHAFATPVRWGGEVEVFGTRVRPGDLIHADKHGFLALPPDDLPGLLEAARFMDTNECRTLIAAARGVAGRPVGELLTQLDAAADDFDRAARAKFGSAK